MPGRPPVPGRRAVDGSDFEHPHAIHRAVVDQVRAGDADGAHAAVLDLLDMARRDHP